MCVKSGGEKRQEVNAFECKLARFAGGKSKDKEISNELFECAGTENGMNLAKNWPNDLKLCLRKI